MIEKKKVLVIVPFPMSEEHLANRRAQLKGVKLSPYIEFHFRGVKAGPSSIASPADYLYMDMAVFEAGLDAQREGFDAVCIDTTSDSGLEALRSVLDIPVISPGKAAMLSCLMLGNRFGIISQWKFSVERIWKMIRRNGFEPFCAAVVNYDSPSDVLNLLGGKEEIVFPKMEIACEKAIEAGADVICLGSTTMHQAASYLAKRLPVPIINPGPLTYKIVETVLDLGVTHSRKAYPKSIAPQDADIHIMFDALAGADHRE